MEEETTRKLASIQKIESIIPIEGKDRIVLAHVLGWQVIVQKEQFDVGDLCIFCEPDSILPEIPEFEFLRPKKFRIKTIKMSGVISQGICFPLSILPKGEYKVGQDVTKVLGIIKYDEYVDEPKEREARGRKYPEFLMRYKWFRKLVLPTRRENRGFPNFISKTDECRVQLIPEVLKNKTPVISSEKIDGSSISMCLVKHKPLLPFMKPRYEYILCSRTMRLWKQDGGNRQYFFVSNKYHVEDVLKNIIGDNQWVAIQGECIAPNVQSNKYCVKEPDLYVFNLIYPNGRLGSLEAKKIIEKNSMKFVPIIDENYILPDTVEEVLEYATGESKLYPTLREGLVIRSKDGVNSFKAVSPDFLIKHGL